MVLLRGVLVELAILCLLATPRHTSPHLASPRHTPPLRPPPPQDPTVRHHFPALLAKTVSGICCFFVLFASLCYLTYGDEVEATITLNLPENNATTGVQIAYCLALLFTYVSDRGVRGVSGVGGVGGVSGVGGAMTDVSNVRILSLSPSLPSLAPFLSPVPPHQPSTPFSPLPLAPSLSRAGTL